MLRFQACEGSQYPPFPEFLFYGKAYDAYEQQKAYCPNGPPNTDARALLASMDSHNGCDSSPGCWHMYLQLKIKRRSCGAFACSVLQPAHLQAGDDNRAADEHSEEQYDGEGVQAPLPLLVVHPAFLIPVERYSETECSNAKPNSPHCKDSGHS